MSKSTFHGSVDGFFSQKKKVVFSNIKHSNDERDISLSKSKPNGNVYSNVKSLSGDDEDISMFGAIVNGFGGITTSSKFEGIIRSTFTSEKSMEMATSLVREKEIVINSNLKRQRIHSDQAVFIKKIPMNTPKKMIIATLTEFGKIKLIKVQLIGLWQKAVIEFAESDQAEFLAAKWSFLIEDVTSNNTKPNHKQTLISNIPPVIIINDELLTAIFPFKLEKLTFTPLFNEVTLEEKPIIIIYTNAKIDGHPIKLILDSKSAGSIITQLMDQLGCQVDYVASTRIITADGATKTPIGKINDLPIEINGIIVSFKVLVIEAIQY
ncbi:hypothetical protein G9A89_016801 [Geosiphon pyriformis]|nr:hypothetical protein G9A89_016801 [Geosiphon pyriformis]